MKSRFLSKAAEKLVPYTPGEQPQDMQYIKLNTNECPYPPAPGVKQALADYDYDRLRLYPDSLAVKLRESMANFYGVEVDQIFAGGGSDEVLGFAFMAFFDEGDKVYYADITYGFYSVYADFCKLNGQVIPLREDYSLAPEDYYGLDSGMCIANPNAPTGMVLEPEQIEEILKRNPDRLVILDEAYIDFAGGRTCVPLINKYDNLLIVQTYSKSRSLAGMRVGCAIGNKALIDDLRRIKFSFNPFNLDPVSMQVGIAAIDDRAYLEETTAKICATRDDTSKKLKEMGFTVLPSYSNFIFAASSKIGGFELYQKLKERGILVRQFQKDRIDRFIRITIGTPEQMEQLVKVLKEIGA